MKVDEVRPGYKRTEVGVIPRDWETSTIGEHFDIQLGKMLDAARNVGTAKLYINNVAVRWGSFDLAQVGSVPLTAPDISRYRLADGDLLICEGGEIGRSAIWHDELPECYFQKTLHRLRARDGRKASFFRYLLELWSSSGFLDRFATQTSIAHLTKEALSVMPLPVPRRTEEQEVIADILDSSERLIQQAQVLLAKKRDLKQAAMQELIPKPQIGFAGTESKIAEIAEVRTGPFGSTLHQRDYVHEGTPIITVEHLGPDRILHENLPRISASDVTRLLSYTLRQGDIVFSRVGSVDRNARVSSTEVGWLFSGRLLRVRITSPEVDSAYLSNYFKTEWFKKKIRDAAVGQTMASLNTGIMNSLVVSLPNLKDQLKAVATLTDMDAEIAALEVRLAKYREIKQGMMQNLLTGAIRLI